MTRLLLPSIATCALASLASPLSAQDEPLRFGGYELAVQGSPGGVSVAERDGREVLTVRRAAAMLKGAEFSEGVIEFDIAFEDKFGFGGVNWHVSEDGQDSEYFYLRQHKSGEPDAGQYTPVRGGLTSWQIFTDANAIAPFAFTNEGWNRVKIVVQGDKADFYLNGSTAPIMHVPDLASDRGRGGIAFRSSGPQGDVDIANLAMRALAPGEGIVGRPALVETPPDGVIGNWAVSQPFDEALVVGQLTLPGAVASLPKIATVVAESFGIADLSRAAAPDVGEDTVLASTRIDAIQARRVRLNFGYSDRVRLFLNGELVFEGEAGWRSRDHFFLGTIGFRDAVVLDLKAGENVLTAAVSETFGGWGLAGAIADRAGLDIKPAR